MTTESPKLGYLDPLAPFEVKLSNEYGTLYAKQIAADWFDGSGMAIASCEYLTRRDYVRQKRLFVRGEHNTKDHKNAYSQRDGALEMVNLRFKHINWAEKFCRIVSNGISESNYKLGITAMDRYSAIQKENKKDYLTKYMVSRPMLEKAMKLQGINLMPQGDIPNDEQEIDYRVNIKERPRIEIAEETLIDYVLSSNNWDWMESQFKKDLVDVGLVICRIYLDKNDGIKAQYIDPEYYVHSRVERSDFSDKRYEGYLDSITINDIHRESNLSMDELRKIAKTHYKSRRNDWDRCTLKEIGGYNIDVLRFAFKTSKEIVYKKSERKGKTVKMSRRSDVWEGSERTRESKVLDTWIEGSYVLGTEFVYNYGECENLFNDIMNKAMSPFITIAHKIYQNRLQSFATNIEEPAAMLQTAHLKVQHLLNELKPDGIAIDINQLAELDDGHGGAKRESWETALNLWETKGIAFVKTIDTGETGVKTGSAITPLAYQQGTALAPLLNVWAHYYNLIRESTGINPARDGSMPSDSLVGLNQLAQLASNTVTRDIVDAAVLFRQKISETISTRLHSIFTYKDAAHLKEIYVNVVGKEMLDGVEVLKNRHLHEFGFKFEMYPTAEEINELKEDMSIAIQAGLIDVATKYETFRLAKINLKQAAEYLKFEIKKTEERKHKMEMERAANKSQNDAAAAQAKSQADTQAYAAKKQIDINYDKQKAELDLLVERGKQQINAPVKEREYQHEEYMQQIKSVGEASTKKYLEDRKDQRTEKQATQQSDLKYQAQTGGQPIDFEAESALFNEEE